MTTGDYALDSRRATGVTEYHVRRRWIDLFATALAEADVSGLFDVLRGLVS